MRLDLFDEIQSASDAELLRLYRRTLLRNTGGIFDHRLERLIAEIKRRSDALVAGNVFVHIETHCFPTAEG